MSVINRMLQDLEARRAASVNAPSAVRATPVEPSGKRLVLWGVAGAAALAAVAFGDWPALLSAQAARAPQPAAVVAADPPRATDAASAKAEPQAVVVAAAATPVPAAVRAVKAEPERAAAPAGVAAAATKPAKAGADTLSLAAATFGLEPTLRSPSATQLAPAVPAAPSIAAPAEPAAAPARAEPAGRVDKQMSPQTPAQRAQMLYLQGMELVGSGHGRMAVERLQQALAVQPTLTLARVQAVSLLAEHGQPAQADALARDGLVLSPGEPQLSYLLARSLAGQGDTPAALAALDRSPNLGADALGLRAGLLSQQGDFKRAAADYEQAVRLQPANSLWWLGLGVALESQGQPQQARRVYARAQSLGMDSHDLNMFLDQKLAALK